MLATFPALSRVPGLAHGATGRAGGVSRGAFASLNLSRTKGDDPVAVVENGRRVAAALGAASPVRFPHQVHGAEVHVLDDPARAAIGPADAVVTALPGVAVGVLGADCPGVLVVDPVRRALAVVHAGWRGVAGRVLPAAIETLRTRFGSHPRDLLAGIGPGISGARYEVGPDVADRFRAAFPGDEGVVWPGRGDRAHLDLRAALRAQLRGAGVPPASVEAIDACTYDSPDRYFSHRRDGEATGRHALVAMWR